MQTDFPEPVAPAISICGIFAISETTICPLIFLPTAKASFDLCFLNSALSSSSRRTTGEFSLFGTSMPTAAFPGIGASIRISVAARFSLISSESFVIWFTFTPCSSFNSYCVTAGPQLILLTVTRTPKLCKVFWSFSAVSFNSLSFIPLPGLGSANRSVEGNSYFFSGVCTGAGSFTGIWTAAVF